jgi:hypothetical protein
LPAIKAKPKDFLELANLSWKFAALIEIGFRQPRREYTSQLMKLATSDPDVEIQILATGELFRIGCDNNTSAMITAKGRNPSPQAGHWPPAGGTCDY